MSTNKKRPFLIEDSDEDDSRKVNSKINKHKRENLDEAGSPSQDTSDEKDSKKTKTEKLGSMKRLCMRSWRKQTLIDIREFYHDENGDPKPGKRGISLTKDQFQYIIDNIDQISKAIAKF
ncbi:hypothetical protein BGZ80_005897 [Entomortierella chlamydospora]|uniref:Transcriptional coactivator p15 (PC4) C-terminal domain-containing protein n=1 Tax=Entomortierella chlamydospora TaxID=101097 RepID=A0A9P6MI95_9FUNG|nr:hypothetical protein BGZ80_005897 [Entomortierella chlamydospora]